MVARAEATACRRRQHNKDANAALEGGSSSGRTPREFSLKSIAPRIYPLPGLPASSRPPRIAHKGLPRGARAPRPRRNLQNAGVHLEGVRGAVPKRQGRIGHESQAWMGLSIERPASYVGGLFVVLPKRIS